MKNPYIFFQDGWLQLRDSRGGFCLQDWAAKAGSPFYIYHLEAIQHRLQFFQKNCPAKVYYAMKANDNPVLLSWVAQQGDVGVDVVSLGEIQKALKAGFPAKKMVFSGVGKTEEEIRGALEFQIGQFNVESPQELLRVAKIAKSLGVVAPVAFRMNPDVNPQTHPYIRTGFRENKFGMDVSFLPQLEKILDSHPQALQLKGLTLHIGSQIQEMDPFKESIRKTWPLFLQLKEKYPSLRVFDVGGGLGIDYEKGDLQSEEQRIRHYGDFLNQFFSGKDDVEVICEPGRILVGPFGLLVTQVQYIKSTPYKNFAIVDTGMHHLIRPALYSAFHRIFPLRDLGAKDERDVYDVVGPICESADVLGKERVLPLLKQGDYLAIADVGAYGAVMSMSYNSHQLPKEYVFVNGEVKKA